MQKKRVIRRPEVPMEGIEFPPSEIHEQMEQILTSAEFNATEAQKKFLRYVVQKTLAGQADEIKGYAVAVDVFGRREDFNQATDPIVSIHANKLRRAIERYYLVEGQNDPIRIDIPKGTYVPTFQAQGRIPGADVSLEDNPAAARIDTHWPKLCIQCLDNLTGNPEFEHLGLVIASEIAFTITRCREIRVIMQPPERRKRRAADTGARFVLNGNVRNNASHLKVNVILTDISTGMQIWADTHRADRNPAQLMCFGEKVARAVAGRISSEYGIIARQMFMESKSMPPHQLSTYEAILRYHEFCLQFTLQSFLDALEALKYASENESECGLLWSMRSRLYSINYGTELFDADTPIEAAVRFALTGVRLDPDNQRTRAALSYALMLTDELPAARAEADRALALNPDTSIFLENVGYLLALLGDWQQGPALIKKAINTNPYYNVIVHHALWLEMFRRENYEQAYLESLNFKTPNLFWDHLIKAATLSHLGRIQEGRQAARELIMLKPDFAERGHVLIRNFIKFDDIVERIIDGLGYVGVDVSRHP